MNELFNFDFYSKSFLKIKTKMDGIQPFVLREYQKRFNLYWDNIKGPVRIITLKPRQAGWTTFIAGKFSHKMGTTSDYRGIAMADKKGRTQSLQKIYSTFSSELPKEIQPMTDKDNTEELAYDNPKKQERGSNPGLRSGILYETAQDPNAGRSESRRFAHLSENAFFRYYREIDEGVQNSIPLSPGTAIIKESTANGRSGIGKPFFDLWTAAERGDSIYKPFFVAWYEVDDYQLNKPSGFRVSKEEREILKLCPSVTEANLVWRRLKIKEYLGDEENQFLTPSERFKQDFPLTPAEAFRHSGQPVFDAKILDRITTQLTNFKPKNMAQTVAKGDFMLMNHITDLRIFAPPRKGKRYIIGADISEGLSIGDFSSAYITDSEYNQVGSWHGKIDPDLFGHLLVSLGKIYNNALLVPEKNNMGHTTVTTIKNEGYYPMYKTVREDKITKQITEEYGWRTTSKSKQEMLNEGMARLRDNNVKIQDIGLPREMEIISRGDNGAVDLNGRDRVVAYCLAMMGIKHFRKPIKVRPGRKSTESYDSGPRKAKKSGFDIFD